MKKYILSLCLILGIAAAGAHAQQPNGITVNQVAYTAATAAAPTSPFRNVGQASHWLNYCTTSATSIAIQLEGSYDFTNWFAISPQTTALGCAVIETGGYYPAVRANLLSIVGGGASVTANYSASSGSIAGGGIAQTSKSSLPVTYLPVNRTKTLLTLNASLTTAITGGAVVYSVWIENTNAAAVYLGLGNVDAGGITDPTAIRAKIPANTAMELEIPAIGVQFPTGVVAQATNTIASGGAPATDCYIVIGYKPMAAVSSKVNSAGAQQATQPSLP